jgi:PAS domain S-box-containing protein
MARDTARAVAARRAHRAQEVAYSSAFTLPNTDPGFLMSAALRPDGHNQGTLVAVFQSRPFVQPLLLRQSAAGALVALSQDGLLIHADTAESRSPVVVSDTFDLDPSRWTLDLRPTAALALTSRSHLPATALWGGSLLSLLLALALDRSLTASQHTHLVASQRSDLKASEVKYRSLVDSMTDGMIVHQDERCVFANPTLASMLGYEVDELVGLTFAEYIGPDHLELATARYRARVAAAGCTKVEPSKSYEIQLSHKDGHRIWVKLHPGLTEFGGRPAVQSVVQDIEARKAIEAALRFEQQRMELVARGSVDGIWDWNVQSGEEYLSDRWYELLGYAPGELPARVETWSDLLHPDDRAQVLAALQGHLVSREAYDVECRMRTKSGAYRWYRCAGQATWDATGKAVRMAGSISDIESRKQTEVARALSEARFRAAMENAPIGTALVSLEGRWLQVNAALCEIVGYSPAELMKLTFQHITHPEDLDEDLALVGDVLAGRIATYSMDKRYIRKDGQDVWVRLSVSLARDLHGAPEFFISQIENIDERMRQERQIRDALQEKELLLREVYHRVKNNLQVIRSLLNLQSRALPEDSSRRALQETAARVRAMALVHEKLYQSGNLSRIAIQEFADDLITQICESTGLDNDRVSIRTEIGALSMGLDTAIPLGLLMNELISNCVKHGFPDGRRGRILVHLLARDDGAELIVEDDGVGLPDGFDATQTRSMGMRLATSLARQLGGPLRHHSQRGLGSRFQVTIASLTEPVEAMANRMSVAEHSQGNRRHTSSWVNEPS